MTRTLLVAALLPLLTVAPPPALAQERPVELSLIRGGAVLGTPNVSGRYVHIPTGRVLTTWDYANPTAPLRVATTAPIEGVIHSLTRRGVYLYASWRGYDSTSGVATFSIADPAKPVLVSHSPPYTSEPYPFATGLVAAKDHLYLFDNNYGLFISDLADPAQPTFTVSPVANTPSQYTSIVANGNLIQASGRNMIGGTVLDVYDIGNPAAPTKIAGHGVDGMTSFSLTLEPALAIGIGNELTLFDLSDPTQMVQRGQLDVLPATSGLRVGSYFYSYGYGDGVDISNIADLDAPTATGRLELSSLGARHAVTLDKTVLLQTDTDLIHSLDVSTPDKPQRTATSWLPGGVGARDIALFRGKTVLLQPNYGLTVSDSDTLAPLSRLEVDLPPRLQDRSFEQLKVVGDRAYLAAWGYGLINVDLSDPLEPRELGRLEFPNAAVLEARDRYVYLAKWTNGGLFGVADVANPSQPSLVWQAELSGQPYQLKIDKRHIYLAESAEANTSTGGLRVFDLANPAAPVEVAHLNEGCGSAFDVAVDSAVSLAYLACEKGLQVVDIAKPDAPKVVGRYDVAQSSLFNKVALHGDRAWFTDGDGLHELDVSDPTRPKQVKRTAIGHTTAERMLATDDGRLYVLTGSAGVHVFDTPQTTVALRNGEAVGGLRGNKGNERLFTFEVPAGVEGPLSILSYGGTGDVSLLVKFGEAPTDANADYRSTRPGNNETVRIAKPKAGTYYIKLVGKTAFANVSLQARHP